MTQLINGEDPFERVVGWTVQKKRELVYDAAEVLRSFKVDRLCAVYATINTSARQRLIDEGFTIADPIDICAQHCLYQALKWHREKHQLEIAYLFYDQGEPFKQRIYDLWLPHERQTIKTIGWGSIGGISEVDMRVTPPIQAADLIAWAISRAHRNKDRDIWATLARQLVWTQDPKTRQKHPGMLTTTGLVLDETQMRQKYKQLAPERTGETLDEMDA